MNRRGFELIEIIIVVAIAAVLVGGGFYLKNFQGQQSTVQTGLDAEKQAQQAVQQINQQTTQEQNSINVATSSLSSIEQGAIVQANRYLIGRVGSNIFNTEFKYSWIKQVHGGNSSLYLVEYLFSPKSDPGESLPIDINVYYGTNIIAYVPNCAADPMKCQIQISRQRALQIAQVNWPEPWSATLDDNYSEGPSFNTFYWSLEASSSIPGCTGTPSQSMSINPMSGAIEATSSECRQLLYP